MWELAIEEAKKLRKYATDSEKKRLNKNEISPQLKSHCIYGKMTGHCESERAQDLIVRSCTKVYNTSCAMTDMSSVKLNGKPKVMEAFSGRTFNYVSPIEFLILYENGGQEAINQIVPFIKGETKKIVIPK